MDIIDKEDKSQKVEIKKTKNKVIKNKIYPIRINENKLSNQNFFKVKGIDVFFPCVPYDEQKKFVEVLITSLINKKHALMESPTGTGKSLSLLSGSVAFLRYYRKQLMDTGNRDNVLQPKIIYLSRTHKQLENLISELDKLPYFTNSVILGSREIYCVNNKDIEDLNSSLINIKCMNLIKNKKCYYFNNTNKELFHGVNILTCDELRAMGRQNCFCPYFFCVEKSNVADVVFMPYNYIFDPIIKERMNINLKGSILIIDEGHNIPDLCTETFSKSIDVNLLNILLNHLRKFEQLFKKKEFISKSLLADVTLNQINIVYNSFFTIVSRFRAFNFDVDPKTNKKGKVLSLNDLSDLFSIKEKENISNNIVNKDNINNDLGNERSDKNTSKINDKKEISFVNILKLVKILGNYRELMHSINKRYYTFDKVIEFFDLLNYIFINGFAGKYRFYIEEEKNLINGNNNNNCSDNYVSIKNIKLHLYCLSASINFGELIKEQFHSIIITSGTLKPYLSFQKELNFQFDYFYDGKHVIDVHKQIFCGIINSINTNNKNCLFNFISKKSGDLEMNNNLLELISKVSNNISGGILIFFSSYNKMNEIRELIHTKKPDIKKKLIFDDQRNKDKQYILNLYKLGVRDVRKNGAILFSVARSVFSEGISFDDEEARLIIIVGIPFANSYDNKIKFKIEYSKNFSEYWYNENAFKSINQSLGRVVRHLYDYGAVLLVDYRYSESVNKSLLSYWVKENIKIYNSVDLTNIINDLNIFYKNARIYVQQIKTNNNFLSDKENIVMNGNSLIFSGKKLLGSDNDFDEKEKEEAFNIFKNDLEL